MDTLVALAVVGVGLGAAVVSARLVLDGVLRLTFRGRVEAGSVKGEATEFSFRASPGA